MSWCSLDGDEHQQTAILDEGRRHERKLTIVLDIIPWFTICGSPASRSATRTAQTDVWMTHHLLMVLSLSRISSRRSS
jgi:hypothetical protein